MRADISETENRKFIEKINATRSWPLSKTNNINLPPVRHLNGKEGTNYAHQK